MIDKLKNYIIIGLSIAVMVLLLLKGCDSNNTDNKVANTPNKTSIVVKDHYDTIIKNNATISFKTVFYPKWDTAYKVDTLVPLNITQYIRKYNDSISDSNITIYTKYQVLGLIQDKQVEYKLKVPRYIIHTIDSTITNTIIKPNRFSISTGLELSGSNTSFNVSPFIGINVKRSVIYARYGMLDKSVGIGAGYIIYNSKK